MNSTKKIWAWVGVAIVVIIVVVAFVWRPAKKSAAPVPVFAPQGQLTPNFPTDLILDPQAQIGSSYSINYDAKTNLYTAQWNSSSSLVLLYNEYETYLGSHAFTVTSASGATSASKLAAVYAMSIHANVNVTIAAQGKGSQVTISYAAH